MAEAGSPFDDIAVVILIEVGEHQSDFLAKLPVQFDVEVFKIDFLPNAKKSDV